MRRPHGKSICSTIWRGSSGGWVWIWGCLFDFPQHKWWKSIECASMLEFPSFWLRTVKIFIQCSSSSAVGAEWNGSSAQDPSALTSLMSREFWLQRLQSCWAVLRGQMDGRTDGRAVNDTHSFKLPFNVNTMTVILIVFGCWDNLCYGRNCYGKCVAYWTWVYMITMCMNVYWYLRDFREFWLRLVVIDSDYVLVLIKN